MLKAMLRPKIFMALLMMIFGIILVSHIKSVSVDETTANLALRYKQRQAELKKSEEQNKALLAENDRLNQAKTKMIADLLSRKGYENLLAELERIQVLAGFTEVKGPGVTLTLNDKPGFNLLQDPAESLVHDSDLRHAIDLFKAAGAGGFAINGLRYTNATYINCIGSTILCNRQRMTPPFIIVALGNPASLAKAIRGDQEFTTRQSAGIGLQVKVEEAAEIVLPPFAEADDFRPFIDLLEVASS